MRLHLMNDEWNASSLSALSEKNVFGTTRLLPPGKSFFFFASEDGSTFGISKQYMSEKIVVDAQLYRYLSFLSALSLCKTRKGKRTQTFSRYETTWDRTNPPTTFGKGWQPPHPYPKGMVLELNFIDVGRRQQSFDLSHEACIPRKAKSVIPFWPNVDFKEKETKPVSATMAVKAESLKPKKDSKKKKAKKGKKGKSEKKGKKGKRKVKIVEKNNAHVPIPLSNPGAIDGGPGVPMKTIRNRYGDDVLTSFKSYISSRKKVWNTTSEQLETSEKDESSMSTSNNAQSQSKKYIIPRRSPRSPRRAVPFVSKGKPLKFFFPNDIKEEIAKCELECRENDANEIGSAKWIETELVKMVEEDEKRKQEFLQRQKERKEKRKKKGKKKKRKKGNK
eukprot:g851.t1